MSIIVRRFHLIASIIGLVITSLTKGMDYIDEVASENS